jgi:hypothetical protein
MEGHGHIHAPTNSRLKTQPPAHIEYEIGWVLKRSGRFREIKTLWGVESRFLGCSALSVITMLTTLSSASTNSVIIKIIQF